MTISETLYNRNGIILKSTPVEEEYLEIELEFAGNIELNIQMLLSVYAFFSVFKKKENTDYVMGSWTLQKCIIRKSSFTDHTGNYIIDSVIKAQERPGLIRRMADESFFIEGNGGFIESNTDNELDRFAVTKCKGKDFVENLFLELG